MPEPYPYFQGMPVDTRFFAGANTLPSAQTGRYLPPGPVDPLELGQAGTNASNLSNLSQQARGFSATMPQFPAATVLPPSDAASLAPGLSQQGISPAVPGSPQEAVPGETSGFNIPTDLFPYSMSASYSGLPEESRTGLLSSLMPQLLSSVEKMPANIDKYTQAGMGAYGSAMRGAATEAMPNILNEVFGRNMQGSSIGGDITRGLLSDVMRSYEPRAYETAMTGAGMKAAMPSLLGQLAGLGQGSTSMGYQENALAPYQLMANLLPQLLGY